MIGVIVVETYLSTEAVGYPAVSPLIPAGHRWWTDVTGAYPHPPDAVAIQVEAPTEWWDTIPEEAIIWVE